MKRIRIFLLPIGLITEFGLLMACGMCVFARCNRAAARILQWSTKTLPDWGWYVGATRTNRRRGLPRRPS